MQETSSHFTESGVLIKQYCSSHLKYHLAEADSYSEMLQYRENLKTNFKKKERTLFEKKEKLFSAKDISKWGVSKEMSDELKHRKE